MTAFTITTIRNIDELTGKTGGDTFAINGGALIIDQHSRFGLNNANTSATAATSMGSITLSATLGGILSIDGTSVRLIAFTGGSGTIPALNSLVTQGGASGKLMCVYSALTAAPLVNGGVMPATGWLQVKQWNNVEYAAGALTLSGITATSSGASVVGFIEIIGDDAGTITTNRLNTVSIVGAPYLLGVTSGVANQTFQIPNNGTLHHAAGVQIETAVGSGVFEPYINAGTATTIGTDSTRGKVVWVDNTGLVRLGHNGTANMGYTPVAGLKVIIGNVFLKGCTTAARNVAKIPHATLASRYDFTTTGGGVVSMQYVDSNWYPSFAQAYSVTLQNVGIVDSLLVSELASTIDWFNVFVGNKPTTASNTTPLSILLSFAGGTITNSVFATPAFAANSGSIAIFTDVADFTFTNCTIRANTLKGFTTVKNFLMTRGSNCHFENHTAIQGTLEFAQSVTCNAVNTIYADTISTTTSTANPVAVFGISASCINTIFEGLTFPVVNNHPYTAILSIGAAGCLNTKLRNIGTPVAPLSLGSASATGLIYTLVAGAAANGVDIERVYCANTRTGIMSADNSSKNINEVNVWGDYADATDVMAALNMVRTGCRATGALTAQVSVYGSHFRDLFTSATAGTIAVLMNEQTADTLSQVHLFGTAAFTSAGGLYMPAIDDKVQFYFPNIIGHTGFQNVALTMAGGTVGNYRFDYCIDLNDGNGLSAFTGNAYTAALLATALNSLTASIDAVKGFKLVLSVMTTTANTTAITSLSIPTTSTTTTQAYQYPMDQVLTTIVANGDLLGSEIRVYDSLNNEIAGIEFCLGNSFSFKTTAGNYVWIQILAAGYQEYGQYYTVSAADAIASLTLSKELNE